MAEQSDDSRTHGVELGSLADELEGESYPLTQGELLERYGDHEVDLASGATPLEEILEAETEREYEDAEAVRQAVLNMVGDEAVGREGYSDRGGSTPEEDAGENKEDESI